LVLHSLSTLFPTMFHLNVPDNNDAVQALHDVADVGLCTLHFTRHYTDVLQAILTSLMLFLLQMYKDLCVLNLLKHSFV